MIVSPKEVMKWCGLAGFLATTIIGQAELIGEPWRHYVTVIGVLCTAICGYLIQHRDEWDGVNRRRASRSSEEKPNGV